MVGFIDQRVRSGRDFAQEVFDFFPRRQAARRIVWIANIDQPGRGIRVTQHRGQVMGVCFRQRYFNDLRACILCMLSQRLESWHWLNQLLPRPQERLRGHSKHLAGAASQDHLISLNAVEMRESFFHLLRRTRIAVKRAGCVADRRDYFGRRTVGVLVSVERSEEHTSELQSRLHLVCRLLLEKKKKKHTPTTTANT